MKCCDITAGSLREPIVLQRENSESDGFGGEVKSFETYATTKAQVKPISGRELVFGMQLEAAITHRIFTRFRADVRPKDRILLRGSPLNIRSVINIEMRNKWLEIVCEQGVAT